MKNKAFLFDLKLLAGLVVMVALAFACARNPVTGKKEFNLMSEKKEIALGMQSDPGIVANFGLYEDKKIQAFIDKHGQDMAKISHRPHLDYEFKILDSPVVNAFAVPGGYVYFTRGIMAHFNNEAEFAGVLGHEIGHVTARHSARQYSTSMLAQVGFIVGVVASKQFRQFANQASQGMQLMLMKFGRDMESQSDKLGVEYSTKIGYDAHEMANFFHTLDRMRQTSGAQEIPTFLSTHPHPADRHRKVGEMATEWQAGKPKSSFKINGDQYLRMIDGLVYGEDPRQGYVEGSYFYHPVLKFQFPIPRNWKTNNTPQQFQMAPENGKAIMILTLAPEKTLDEAATNFLQKNQLTAINKQRDNVNGLSAIVLTSEQVPQQQQGQQQQQQQQQQPPLRIMTYFIQYNGMIYMMHGMAAKTDFPSYRNTFANTMTNFKKLNDPSKINVKPERIKIVPVKQSGTLSAALNAYGMPSAKMEELSLINGMQLNETVNAGKLIKVLEKK